MLNVLNDGDELFKSRCWGSLARPDGDVDSRTGFGSCGSSDDMFLVVLRVAYGVSMSGSMQPLLASG